MPQPTFGGGGFGCIFSVWHTAEFCSLTALSSLSATEMPLAILCANRRLITAGVCEAGEEATLLWRRLLDWLGIVVQADVFEVFFFAHGWDNWHWAGTGEVCAFARRRLESAAVQRGARTVAGHDWRTAGDVL